MGRKFVAMVAKQNVLLTLDKIREFSPILKTMEDNREILLVGSMYDVETGQVGFYE